MATAGKLARWLVRQPTRLALNAAPLSLWRRRFPKDCVCTYYHLVSDGEAPHMKYYPFKTPAQFELDARYVREHFPPLTYETLLHRRRGGEALGPRDNAFLITFDDGFAECATVAAPILARHDVHAVFFVTTDLIDNRVLFHESAVSLCIDALEGVPDSDLPPLVEALGLSGRLPPEPRRDFFAVGQAPWECVRLKRPAHGFRLRLVYLLLGLNGMDRALIDRFCAALGVDGQRFLRERRPYLTGAQLRELASAGFTLGAHSVSHPLMSTLSTEQVERQIVESCAAVRDLTGQRSVPFAFPHNGRGIDRRHLASIRQRHPFVGLFFDTGCLCRDEPFVVQRLGADGPDPRHKGVSNLPRLLRNVWSARAAWH